MSRYERVSPYDQVDGEYTPGPGSPTKIPLVPPSRRQSSASGSIFAAERNPPPETFIPFYLRTWVVLSVAIGMIFLAAGVEIALYRSQLNQGWRIRGIQLLGGINFLKSVVPVVLTVPISIFWVSVDRDIGQFQPYVALSKGRAPADRSLLLDYGQGRTNTILRSFHYGHWAVLLSSFVCMANLGLSSLASGLLTTHNAVIKTPSVTVQTVKTLGLDPDYVTLEYFNAAAGYSMAAAINNLTDPPFLFKGSWAIAEFKVPSPIGLGVNETIIVPSTAIESTAGCEPADSVSLTSAVGIGQNMTITGTWDGCTVTFGANHTGNDGYGVLPLSDCQTHPEPAPFRPVLFWMYSADLDKAELTFCQPKIDLWNVVAEASLVTGTITNVTLIDQNLPANNISGAPLNGIPFNGVEFDVAGENLYVKARALSVQTGVAGAVYRGADPFGGATAVMQTDHGFLNITENVYTRFLALVAKSTYFNDVETTVQTTITSYDVRLAVYPLAAHAFAAALTFIAILATINHFIHCRERSQTRIACAPTTIAGAVSTASYSKFAAALQGGMNEDEIRAALAGRTYCISRRTWQIEATDDVEDYHPPERRPPLELRLGSRSSVASYDSGKTATGPYSPEMRLDGKR
ncbi:hypothetical protein M407DRAFT_25217 [Tulasnella calospora MUT 4182]|uniref:Uncharacterized protein n=1 Tax=Tulasnella calospora MUT 4182 TaxID=1051891 RepID=A0A0C3QGG6_9AGAM|nr:hypothetical protein M407DRAFT_25217 [Tulasnella calospora MUT 4182]